MTRSALAERPAALRGAQRPRLFWTPPNPASLEAGLEVIDFCAGIGLDLDDWQRFSLTHTLAENAVGRWQSFEVAQVLSRQNGKDAWLEGRELGGLYVLDEELLIHTTHEFKTTREHFRRIVGWLDNVDSLRKRVRKINRAHGEEGIELLDGSRLLFHARTGNSGRGFSCDCLIYNEGQKLKADAVRASMPALSARPNPQVIYTATAGGEDAEMLGAVRERGIAGGDPALTFMEFSADEDAYTAAMRAGADAVTAFETDPANILIANPGIGAPRPSALSFEHCLREQRAMMGEPGAYAMERLGIGRWPRSGAGNGPIKPEAWSAVQDATSVVLDPVVFAVAVSVDGSWSAIATAGLREDGLRGVEVIEHRAGVHWVGARLLELRDEHKPSAIVINSAGRAGSLVVSLTNDHGLDVHSGKGDPASGALVLLDGRDVTGAFGAFVSAVAEEPTTLRVVPAPVLDAAVAHASTRWVGQAQAWDGKNLTDISTLEAVTLAAYGHAKYGTDTTESVYESRGVVLL